MKSNLLTTTSVGADPGFVPKDAGAYLGGGGSPLSESTLANWRTSGIGPEYEKIGGRVIYRKSALDAFRASRRRRSTSEAA
jgi:hypothetical protein